jgi:hypothetical protein
MGAIIIIDPNVLLAAAESDRQSLWSLEEIFDRRAEIAIGIDAANKIFDEYTRIQAKLIAHETTQAFIKFFFDRRNTKLIRIQNATVDHIEKQWLMANQCGIPVEPELVIVGSRGSRDAFLLVLAGSYISPSVKKRGSDDPEIIEKLHRRYPTLEIWSVSEMRKKVSLLDRSRHPANEEQLLNYIQSGEDEYKECKQPARYQGSQRIDQTNWNHNIIKQAFKAVCAMVNSDGGCVLIGVNPSKQIIGIDPVYDSSGQPDDDALSRRFTDHFDSFQPCINRFVKPAIISLKNGRRVVLLHVFKGESNIQYNFDDGRERAEYDRCGPSTRKTRYVGPNRKRW